VLLKSFVLKTKWGCRDLDARVRHWLVRAWVWILFEAIFADILRGWFKLMDVSSSIFKFNMKAFIPHKKGCLL